MSKTQENKTITAEIATKLTDVSTELANTTSDFRDYFTSKLADMKVDLILALHKAHSEMLASVSLAKIILEIDPADGFIRDQMTRAQALSEKMGTLIAIEVDNLKRAKSAL